MKFNRYRKMDSYKEFFLLSNDIFCLDLCPGEIAVYAYLIRKEDRKHTNAIRVLRLLPNLLV